MSGTSWISGGPSRTGPRHSAGACTALWLAFHNDLADPQSADPVARESTRLVCVAVERAQTSLDPAQMRAWTPNSDYGGQAFGFTTNAARRDALWSGFERFLAARERILPQIEAYSPHAHVSADDPPVFSWNTARRRISGRRSRTRRTERTSAWRCSAGCARSVANAN